MVVDIQPLEYVLELILGSNVVIGPQHGHVERLPETAGTDVEEILVRRFHLRNEHRLVHIVEVPEADVFEIGLSVGQFSSRLHGRNIYFAIIRNFKEDCKIRIDAQVSSKRRFLFRPNH